MHSKRILSLLLALVMLFSFTACGLDQETVDLALDVAEVLLTETEEEAAEPAPEETPEIAVTEEASPIEAKPETPVEEPAAEKESTEEQPVDDLPAIAKDGAYTTKEDVSLYIYTYGCLPDNFVTKKTARSWGWEGGGLDPYLEGGCIGGDRFGNYEGLLPEKDGRTYTECDIDTMHASSRGAKRIVFSNDGLIYYTDDHYESFTLLYGDENQ